jgi:hypothetical protein
MMATGSLSPLPSGIPSSELSTPLVSRFVIRFSHPRGYLHSYLDAEGILTTPDLRDAKLFPDFTVARRVANLFHGEPVRVICTLDGRDVRAALINAVFETVLEGGTSEEKQTTSRGADSGEEAPRTFFAVRLPEQPAIDGRTLFFNFLSDYLGVSVFGIQPGFKHLSDVYLFQGPHGTTMSVPTSVMLLDRDSALAIVREKIAQKIKAFGGRQ